MIIGTIKQKSFLWLFLLTLSLGKISFGQENLIEKNSSVKGVVNSNKNEPVEGVSVIIRNTKTNFTSGTTTDANGSFSFLRIPLGGPYNFIF